MSAPARQRPLTDLQQRVLGLVQHRALTLGSVASQTLTTRGQATRALNVLIDRGLIQYSDGYFHRRHP